MLLPIHRIHSTRVFRHGSSIGESVGDSFRRCYPSVLLFLLLCTAPSLSLARPMQLPLSSVRRRFFFARRRLPKCYCSIEPRPYIFPKREAINALSGNIRDAQTDSTKSTRSGYSTVFFFLLAVRSHDDVYYPIWYRSMYNISPSTEEQQRQQRQKRKKNYFGTSGYTQDDIATAVLFADNLGRGDIQTNTHTRSSISSVSFS